MSPDPDDLDWTRLTRYLTGDLSPAEAEAVERWFEADPRHRALLDELRAVWQATAGEAAGWNTERAMLELRSRAATERQTQAARTGAARRPAPSFAFARSRSWTALAAGIAAIVIGGATARMLFFRSGTPAPRTLAAAPATDVVTRRAQQAEIRLTDGSRVILGAASRLTYAGDFGRQDRTVLLDGEAYFDVVHDPAKPFRVRTSHGVAEDVGTAFSVRARETTPLQVVVAEGIVALKAAAHNSAGDSLLLTRNQLGRVLPDGKLVLQPQVNAQAYLAWTRGELAFDGTPLGEVADELSRWYDADVRVATPAIANRRFSGRFSRRSLEDAVRLVATVADVSVRRSGSGWAFK